MWHRLTFVEDLTVDLSRGPRHYLEQVLVEAGQVVTATVKPYIGEDMTGTPVELADLYLGGGETLIAVPFACFVFED
jgi:hypothetical protein